MGESIVRDKYLGSYGCWIVLIIDCKKDKEVINLRNERIFMDFKDMQNHCKDKKSVLPPLFWIIFSPYINYDDMGGYFISIIYLTLINCFYHRDKNITFTSLSSIVRKAVALEKLRYFAELSSSASRNSLSLKTCEEMSAHSVLEDSIRSQQAYVFMKRISPNFSGSNFFRLCFYLIGFSRLLAYSLNWKNFEPRFCRYCNK